MYEGISKDNTRTTYIIDQRLIQLKRTASLDFKSQLHNLMPEVQRCVVELREEGIDLTDGEVLAFMVIRSVQIIDELERKQNDGNRNSPRYPEGDPRNRIRAPGGLYVPGRVRPDTRHIINPD